MLIFNRTGKKLLYHGRDFVLNQIRLFFYLVLNFKYVIYVVVIPFMVENIITKQGGLYSFRILHSQSFQIKYQKNVKTEICLWRLNVGNSSQFGVIIPFVAFLLESFSKLV